MSVVVADEPIVAEATFQDRSPAWRQTECGMTYLPAADKLWRAASTPYEARYRVLGIPLDFSSNSGDLLCLADDVFGGAKRSDFAALRGAKRLDLFLHEVPTGTADIPAHSPTMRMRGSRFFLSCGDSFGFADRASGVATAFVTPEMAADRSATQLNFIECLGLFLAAADRPVTLHAAAVVRHGRCVLLTGEHGAGKSTLAYACLRAGFQLMAEDVIFGNRVEDSTPAAFEIWGNPRFLHLLPDSMRFFPGLARATAVDQLNGERKLRIDVSKLGVGASVECGSVWGVCSLGRSSGRRTFLRPADRAAVVRALTHFEGDPPIDSAASSAAAVRLLDGRVAHLEVGCDLDEAVRVLRRWIDTG